VFDAAMVGLLREEQRLAGGEVGALGADPLCECQDIAFHPTVDEVAVTEPGKAQAVVTVSATNSFVLDLVVENGAWRIHDIVSAAYPDQSLIRYLTEANREAAQPPK